MTPEEEWRNGTYAKQALDNPAYNGAYELIQERILSLLAQVDLPEDRRIRLNYLWIALNTVRKQMENVMSGGKMAAEQIERDKTFAERVKDRIRSVA